MSQLAPARPLPRTAPRQAGAPAPRQLKVVAPPEIRGNGAFLALCVALLLGGFVGVLMLNTAMAKGSYTLRDLQHRSDELTDTQDSLRHSVDAVSGPGPLAKRARELGMVPAATPAFLRLSDGAVLGVANPATQDSTFRVVTETASPPRAPAVPRASTPAAAPVPSTATTTSPAPTSPAPTSPAATPTATSSSATPTPTTTESP
ncbi:MAG TPA: hypothetical protein VLA55_06380 [Ornithinibacter sp.]|nr:hypothetical protein [Ornithinibacter sp.]